jgi:hypothetical protein
MTQFASAALGALVTLLVVLLTRETETVKHFRALRTSAYVDFIRGIAGLAIFQKRGIESEQENARGKEMLILVTDAKARIAIYGGESVVSSLARFMRGEAVLDTPERAREFTRVCQQMRNDRSYKVGRVADDDVHFLLFELDPKDYLGEEPTAR